MTGNEVLGLNAKNDLLCRGVGASGAEHQQGKVRIDATSKLKLVLVSSIRTRAIGPEYQFAPAHFPFFSAASSLVLPSMLMPGQPILYQANIASRPAGRQASVNPSSNGKSA